MRELIIGLVAATLVIPTVLRKVGTRRSSMWFVLAALALQAVLLLAILVLLCALAISRREAGWALPLIAASASVGITIAVLVVRRLKRTPL
jgi:hypothetical protein